MKKILFTTYIIALIALVPAVIFGYMNADGQSKNNNKTELVNDAANNTEESGFIHVVKTF